MTPTPAFADEHIGTRDLPLITGAAGSGSEPSIGCCYAVVHAPAIGSLVAKMIGNLTHPRTAAQTAEDIRLRDQEIDLTRIHVEIVAGHGGTSALAVFVVAECVRNWLRSQNRPFHLCGRFLLASGQASLPRSVQPILLRNTAIQISYLDAVQSRSPLVKRELAMVTDDRIQGDGGALFEETILYGQPPGQSLSVDDYTRTVADTYFHELTGKAGTYLVSRELDFRNTKAAQNLNGKLTHHSAVGCREISAFPSDMNDRLSELIKHELVTRELRAAMMSHEANAVLDAAVLLLDSLVSTLGRARASLPSQPPINKAMEPNVLRAVNARFQSQLRNWRCQSEKILGRIWAKRSAEFTKKLKETLHGDPFGSQVQVLEVLVERCMRMSTACGEQAQSAESENEYAQAENDAQMGKPQRTDEWVADVRSTWQRLAETASKPLYRFQQECWAALASGLRREMRRLQEVLETLRSLEIRIPPPRAEKPSIVSSRDLIRAGTACIEAALQRLRRQLSGTEKSDSVERVLHESLQNLALEVAAHILSRHSTVGAALGILADQGIPVCDRLHEEIERTEPMLTADSTLLAAAPLHETNVIVLPEGTRAELISKGINLTGLHGAVVLEDCVEYLVVLRAFRGYATPVIPEVSQALQSLFKAYQCNPNAGAPWPHTHDAVPLPLLPDEQELQAGALFARVLGVNGLDGMPAIKVNGGTTYFIMGERSIPLGNDDDDLLDGWITAIRMGEIDPAAVTRAVDKFYEHHWRVNERDCLIRIAQEKLNETRGSDYVTAMRLQTAIDWYVRIKSDRLERRRTVLGTCSAESAKG